MLASLVTAGVPVVVGVEEDERVSDVLAVSSVLPSVLNKVEVVGPCE